MAEPKTTVDETIENADIVTDDVVEEGVSSANATNVVEVIKGLNTPGAAFYSSVVGTDFATKKKIAAALTSSTPLDEMLGEVIKLKDYIVLPVDLANDRGEVNTAPRVILIDSDGVAYHATSVGLLSAIRNLNATLGEPAEWDEPVDIKVVQQKGNNGFKFFTINLVA